VGGCSIYTREFSSSASSGLYLVWCSRSTTRKFLCEFLKVLSFFMFRSNERKKESSLEVLETLSFGVRCG
jgi:hypothetical protein